MSLIGTHVFVCALDIIKLCTDAYYSEVPEIWHNFVGVVQSPEVHLPKYKALFTWDQDEVKPEWKLKLFAWHRYENHKMFNLFPLPGNFLFRWLLLECVVPMSRLQPRPVWNVYVYIYPGLNSCRSEVSRHAVQQAEWLDILRQWQNVIYYVISKLFCDVNCSLLYIVKLSLCHVFRTVAIWRILLANCFCSR